MFKKSYGTADGTLFFYLITGNRLYERLRLRTVVFGVRGAFSVNSLVSTALDCHYLTPNSEKPSCFLWIC